MRVALGAQTSEILGLVIKHGMRLTLAGVLIGLGGAFALSRLMTTFLFQVAPFDPMTFVLVVAILMAVSLAACWLAARRVFSSVRGGEPQKGAFGNRQSRLAIGFSFGGMGLSGHSCWWRSRSSSLL